MRVETPEGVWVEFDDYGFFSFHRANDPNQEPYKFEVIEYVAPEMGQPSILDRIKELFDDLREGYG